MHVELTRWADGKVGLSLSVGKAELQVLIARLKELAADPEQHFHISHITGTLSDVGDIEVYFEESAKNNMALSSHALGAGHTIGES
jgi:hypothetical protein